MGGESGIPLPKIRVNSLIGLEQRSPKPLGKGSNPFWPAIPPYGEESNSAPAYGGWTVPSLLNEEGSKKERFIEMQSIHALHVVGGFFLLVGMIGYGTGKFSISSILLRISLFFWQLAHSLRGFKATFKAQGQAQRENFV